jgi:hypothetical protein
MEKRLSKLEAVLWNIALPGFSQILIGQYVKGFLFVLFEVLVNVMANFNKAILFSFNGEINQAFQVVNYQWLMFYPCLYMFALWDAYRTAMPKTEKLSFLPFVFGAYFVTVGLMYSEKVKIFGVLIGPVFLPMLFLLPGLIIGFLLRWIILSTQRESI